MTTRQEAIAACLQLPDVYEDYPFDDFNWTAIRHRANQKIFALIFERENHIWINVKAQPMWADFWRRTFSAVVPAYHMNKEHWISIILDGSMKDVDIRRLIEESFALTAPKTRIPRIQKSMHHPPKRRPPAHEKGREPFEVPGLFRYKFLPRCRSIIS